jgi:restriction endonuclease/topoisomerase-like DNA binding C4 zinc finger protein
MCRSFRGSMKPIPKGLLLFLFAALFWPTILSSIRYFGGLTTLGIYIGACLLWGLFSARKLPGRREVCAHGVRAGAIGRCPTCGEEATQREAEIKSKSEADARDRQRLGEIATNAQKMRASELERLSKAWVSHAEAYFKMDPQKFENAIAELFRTMGYRVEQTPFTNDGGKDAVAWKDGKKFLIECKRYGETNSVGRRDLQIFVAAMHEEKADAGFYINTGVFARTVTDYAEKNRITIYDRARFPLLVNQAYPQPGDFSTAKVTCFRCGSIISMPVRDVPTTDECPNGHPVTSDIYKRDLGFFTSIPDCVKCGSPMKIVRGWQKEFWGCSRYPKCRSKRPIK